MREEVHMRIKTRFLLSMYLKNISVCRHLEKLLVKNSYFVSFTFNLQRTCMISVFAHDFIFLEDVFF